MTTGKLETETAKPVSPMPWFCVSWSAAEVGLVWWAVATDAPGPGNVVKLLAALSVILAPPGLLAAATNKEPDKRKPWLRNLATVADAIQVLTLCWWGWWWCSVAFAIGALASAAVRYRGGETQNSVLSNPSSHKCLTGEPHGKHYHKECLPMSEVIKMQ